MSIQLVYIGRDKKNIYAEAEREFVKRIKRYTKFDILALNPPKLSSASPRQLFQSKEEDLLLEKLSPNSHFILLDEKGKEFDSKGFAKFLDNKRSQHSKINFIVGGAYGFSETFRQKHKDIVSLSKLTFPHHMARLVFLEQLYRGFTILNNEPYHNQ